MGKGIREAARAQDLEPLSLSELIHHEIRVAIETAVHEELRAALRTTPYERAEVRRGYRNGTKTRTLTGPTGPVPLTLAARHAVRRGEGMDVEDRSALSAAHARGQRSDRRHVLGGRQHPTDTWRAPAASQGRATLEERGVARDRHAEERS
jgi:hypothetical protein